MPVHEDSELLEWLDTLARLNPVKFRELRAALGELAGSETHTAMLFSAVVGMLSNFEQLPSAIPFS